jgi:hypothetical protein
MPEIFLLMLIGILIILGLVFILYEPELFLFTIIVWCIAALGAGWWIKAERYCEITYAELQQLDTAMVVMNGDNIVNISQSWSNSV